MPNVGDKFIVEIYTVCDVGRRHAYRIKGIEDVFFTEEEIGKFEKVDENFLADLEVTAYNRGLNDAWEAARKICGSSSYGGLLTADLREIFSNSCAPDLVYTISAAEAIEKLRAYDEQQKTANEIRVGDEVAFHHSDGRVDTIVVVTHVGIDGYINGMNSRGDLYGDKDPTYWTKTGRHFPQVEELLRSLGGDSDENIPINASSCK